MTREDLIQEIKRECQLKDEDPVIFLIPRAITEAEEVLGKYYEYKEVEATKRGPIPTGNYEYYIVTDSKFVKIFTSKKECWYKVCPLDKFIGIEEKFLITESQELNVQFDVPDNELRQIKFKIERANAHREIKERRIEEFVSALAKAVSDRLKG